MKHTMKHTGVLLLVIIGISFLHMKKIDRTTRKISGQVLSINERLPLEGVSIFAKESKAVSGTQPDGYFYIQVAVNDSTLTFEKEGYMSREIRLGNQQEYNIELQPR